MNIRITAIIASAIVVLALLALGGYALSGSGHTIATAPPRISIDNPVHINNNLAPSPTPVPGPTQYVPVPGPTQYVPAPAPASSDAWSVAQEYMNDVNTPGGNSAAWSLLGPSVQASWSSNYDTFVAWADPTSFRNFNEVSASGDTVTFTVDLHNGTYGTSVSYTNTFTVDNGLITGNTSSQN